MNIKNPNTAVRFTSVVALAASAFLFQKTRIGAVAGVAIAALTFASSERLVFNVGLLFNAWKYRTKRANRYDKIEGTEIYLSSLPTREMFKEIQPKAVLSAVKKEEFHWSLFWTFLKPDDYKGVNYKLIETPDFDPLTKEKIQEGVDFLRSNHGLKTIVHCKSGVGRSATLVAAYLMELKSLTAEDAVHHLKKTRRVNLNTRQMAALKAWHTASSPAKKSD